MSDNARGLIRSMAIMGTTQTANIVISIIRLKALALMLGPSGVGLLGVFTNLLDMVKTAAGLGIGKSGVRQIASAKRDEIVLSRVSRVLLVAHVVQGAAAMVVVWIFRAEISQWLLGDSLYKNEVGLIGVAILLTLIGTAHTALLQGMRCIDDLGRVTVYSSLIGTIAGLVAIWFFGESGLIWFIVIQPLATIIIASKYTKRLPISKKNILGTNEVWDILKPMFKLGAAFMLGGLVTSVTMIIVRQRIIQELGLMQQDYLLLLGVSQ